MALPAAYGPASIALRVTGPRKPPRHDKAVVLEEEQLLSSQQICSILWNPNVQMTVNKIYKFVTMVH
jgi:hypothetical protein